MNSDNPSGSSNQIDDDIPPVSSQLGQPLTVDLMVNDPLSLLQSNGVSEDPDPDQISDSDSVMVPVSVPSPSSVDSQSVWVTHEEANDGFSSSCECDDDYNVYCDDHLDEACQRLFDRWEGKSDFCYGCIHKTVGDAVMGMDETECFLESPHPSDSDQFLHMVSNYNLLFKKIRKLEERIKQLTDETPPA